MERGAMAEVREDGSRPELRVGIGVVVFALLVVISPFVGKVCLLKNVPPPPYVSHMHDSGNSSITTDFIRRQMDELSQRALSDGEQMAEQHSQSKARLMDYRHSIIVLNQLRLKFEQSIQATERERCLPYTHYWTQVEEREQGFREARRLHAYMMPALTLGAVLFSFIVLRSQRVPIWAKYFSMIAAGAVISGRFPL
jgi:hypothetical protein